MGNYTELFVRVELRKDAPEAVLAALAAYAKGDPVIPGGLADHEFFDSPDWDRVLSMGDYVTPTAQQPVQFWLDERDNPDQWRLIVHCSAKNYHGSFEKFLDWIIPFVDARPGKFLGYVLNEDNADELRLIFYPPADHRYLTVVETSPGGEGAAVERQAVEMAQTLVVKPIDLRAGDEIVGMQRLGEGDDVSPRHQAIVKVGVGEHPVAGGECVQLHRRPGDPAGYELNLWNGREYFDWTLFHIRRAAS
ncbi:hypothetical protein IUS39_23965 [Mycobacteroides abscessus subsp. massiliense]|uniref:hypothetical protein n=1 Tax=Mycobacteroides abscessus TaxID=36809 RepID=UPI00092B5090|nr:hypothetical protein [Mycobacteroides abscessus]MBN7428736.1 hypothetical protein [Mycobacteroides abscessus subsp. massiliense]SIN48417.1 Uncharacterised protein [Mycobacteroides abscessus subsp. bolletii]